jgi:N-acetylglucosaminyl-diphospho-decaprenol L-rhamnosyltransferase
MLMPRAAIERIGGFDERFFFYAEDLEWCWRAHTLGMEIWFEPKAVVHHVSSASGDQLYPGVRTKAHLHNALTFYRRAHGTPRAIAWWALNTSGAAVRVAKAIRRRDRAAATRWAAYVRAQATAPFAKERRR